MVTWTDSDGRAWPVEFTFENLKLLKKELKLDILAGTEKLSEDPMLCVDVIYWIGPAPAEGLSTDDFGRRVRDADVIRAASDAVMEAYADFSPKHGSAIRQRLERMRDLAERAEKAGADHYDRMLDEIETKLSAGTLFGNSSASPASAPATST